MAKGVQVFGACDVYLGTTEIGYSRDGARVVNRGYFHRVDSDENGGPEGPPIDIQYLGETEHIRIELTNFDSLAVDQLGSRLAGGTAGVPGPTGTLLFAGGKSFVVKLKGAAKTRTYGRCTVEEPIEVNKGSKYSILVLDITAHKDVSGNTYTEAANT